jgi:hypothetical protein
VTTDKSRNHLLLILSFWPVFAHAAFTSNETSSDSFWISLQDTQHLLLELTYDNKGIPQNYSSEIFTQVCETGECKPVRIRLFWDLIGQYQSYKMPENAILTKMDHVPFSGDDYIKFAEILRNTSSVLESFDLSELTGSKEKATVSQIDGITGATPKSISSAIVQGAVYTCYTVWHFAHGAIQDSISSLTKSIANNELVSHILNHSNLDYQRWAVNHVFENNPAFIDIDLILKKINADNIFLAKYILQRIPDTWLDKELVQEDIWYKFPKLPYTLQILVLKRFTKTKVLGSLKTVIDACVKEANYEQKQFFNSLEFR